MSYIGKQPASVALASSDITDGIISTAKLADTSITNAKLNADIISAETDLAVSPVSTDEIIISDAGTLKRMDCSVFGNTPYFLAHATADQVSTDQAETKVQWTELNDVGACFASDRFTVPANEDGKYFVSVQVTIQDTDSDMSRYDLVVKKGTAYQQVLRFMDTTNPTAKEITLSGSRIWDMNATDYLEVYIYCDTTDSSDVNILAYHNYECLFSGFKLTGTD
tara:strand:+ start:41 stop:709 length:669 start_codon:yes stop_codon:yes gene_type:complete